MAASRSILLVDAGNTRVKWALAELCGHGGHASAWLASGSVAHAEIDQLGAAWATLKPARVLASNVAGAEVGARIAGQLPAGLAPEWFAAAEERGGLRNRYREPARLGSDRFAAAIAAHALYPATPLVVATCGTATTVDAVSADGQFLGGMILPGLALMAQSLAKNTAQLPQVAAELDVAHPFADHTEAAIASGCLSAQAGAIARAVAALEAQVRGGPPVCCILSGGAGALIAPHLPFAATRVENLVLTGLFTVATMEETC